MDKAEEPSEAGDAEPTAVTAEEVAEAAEAAEAAAPQYSATTAGSWGTLSVTVGRKGPIMKKALTTRKCQSGR